MSQARPRAMRTSSMTFPHVCKEVHEKSACTLLKVYSHWLILALTQNRHMISTKHLIWLTLFSLLHIFIWLECLLNCLTTKRISRFARFIAPGATWGVSLTGMAQHLVMKMDTWWVCPHVVGTGQMLPDSDEIIRSGHVQSTTQAWPTRG